MIRVKNDSWIINLMGSNCYVVVKESYLEYLRLAKNRHDQLLENL